MYVHRGKIVIAAIVLVAAAMSTFAWWYRYEHGRLALELWGPRNAVLIRHARRVELLVLETTARQPAPPAHRLVVGGSNLAISRKIDISQAHGLVHARHALIEDATYEWKNVNGERPVVWRYALRFTDDRQRQATLAFDAGCRRVRLAGTDREATINARLARGLREFVEMQ